MQGSWGNGSSRIDAENTLSRLGCNEGNFIEVVWSTRWNVGGTEGTVHFDDCRSSDERLCGIESRKVNVDICSRYTPRLQEVGVLRSRTTRARNGRRHDALRSEVGRAFLNDSEQGFAESGVIGRIECLGARLRSPSLPHCFAHCFDCFDIQLSWSGDAPCSIEGLSECACYAGQTCVVSRSRVGGHTVAHSHSSEGTSECGGENENLLGDVHGGLSYLVT